MKRFVVTTGWLLTLALSMLLHAQDETFTQLDVLKDYEAELTYAETECQQEDAFEQTTCIIDTLESQCVEAYIDEHVLRDSSVIGCASIAYAMWDAKLNEYYQRLMANLSEERQASLRDAQRAWLAFHAQDTESLTPLLRLEQQGLVDLLMAKIYEVSAIQARSQQLYELLSFIELTYGE